MSSPSRIDFEYLVDGIADDREFVECCPEQNLLQDAADNRQQDNESGMKRLGRIETPEIACVVVDEDEVALAGVAEAFQSFHPALPTRATC